MFQLMPDYYPEFHCIAGKCRHSCCASWEIDIDEESLARYERDGLPNIVKGEPPHFAMKEGRCAFLNSENLCELILKEGEDYLCQICRDHPRFRNYWTDACEVGLGLCCEEAARLILSRKQPMGLVIREEESGRRLTPDEFAAGLPEDERYLFGLRQELLAQAADIPDPLTARLAEYFIYRQLPDALYDGYLEERIRWIQDCIIRVTEAWDRSTEQSFDTLCELARAFSEDTEYDPEGIQKRLFELQTEAEANTGTE